MTAKIHQLSANLTNQIAAGEVIERPASVVKELVENSIDAGSNRIRIDFVAAGLKSITVQDNGSGIPRDQIDLAFMRHATSKINNEHDLFKVTTLGFRGEALASIAAVAHVQIITSAGGQMGTRADFSGGSKKDQEPAGAQPGTKITVSDLFFNTPARLKYLRSPRTETMKIVDIINRLALGYPHISFTLANKGKVLMRTPGNGNLRQTVANVYGRHIAEKMLPFASKDDDFTVSGLISQPSLTRSNRHFISILLNGRYIKNFKLSTAVMNGYGSKLPAKHYPVAVVQIAVDPLLVDVNVHPTKEEVRLSKEKELGRLITTAISDALLSDHEQEDALANLTSNRQASLVDQLQFNLNQDVVNSKRQAADFPQVAESPTQNHFGKRSSYVDLAQPRHNQHYLITATWQQNVAEQVKLAPFSGDAASLDSALISAGDDVVANQLPALRFIGQTEQYLFASQQGNLYLIDQLSARRRLAFDKISRLLSKKKILQQGLLTPIVLEFGHLDFMQIESQKEKIKKLGIILEDFGQDSFIVRSYPTWLKGDISTAIRKTLEEFLDEDQANLQKLKGRIAARAAKQEVKRRISLTAGEAKDLLQQLRKSTDPYHDAEGNLVIVRFSQNELAKMFKKGV